MRVPYRDDFSKQKKLFALEKMKKEATDILKNA